MKRIAKVDDWVVEYIDNDPNLVLENYNIQEIKTSLQQDNLTGFYKNQYSWGTWKFISSIHTYFNVGNKTQWYTWRNDLGYLWCFIWRHNYRMGYHMDLEENFEHCIRCERFGNLYDLPTLNLCFYWTNIIVWVWWNYFWKK